MAILLGFKYNKPCKMTILWGQEEKKRVNWPNFYSTASFADTFSWGYERVELFDTFYSLFSWLRASFVYLNAMLRIFLEYSLFSVQICFSETNPLFLCKLIFLKQFSFFAGKTLICWRISFFHRLHLSRSIAFKFLFSSHVPRALWKKSKQKRIIA